MFIGESCYSTTLGLASNLKHLHTCRGGERSDIQRGGGERNDVQHGREERNDVQCGGGERSDVERGGGERSNVEGVTC